MENVCFGKRINTAFLNAFMWQLTLQHFLVKKKFSLKVKSLESIEEDKVI